MGKYAHIRIKINLKRKRKWKYQGEKINWVYSERFAVIGEELGIFGKNEATKKTVVVCYGDLQLESYYFRNVSSKNKINMLACAAMLDSSKINNNK